MREIKFRAWDVKQKQMIMSVGIPAGDFSEDPIRYTRNEVYIRPDSVHYALMQYTGLRDKNGREIYEGDVIQDDYGHLSEIVFNCGQFCIPGKYGKYYKGIKSRIQYGGKVIGNIHESPELLK